MLNRYLRPLAVKLLSLVLLGGTTSSCATIFTGTRDAILFTSEPAGATVYLDGEAYGTTPVYLDVKRNLGQRWVKLEADGYEPDYQLLKKRFNWVATLNLTCLSCWAVDLASGGVVKYKDRTIHVALEPCLDEPPE